MDMEIHGKLILITGASSGVGAAIAGAAARRGGRVLLLARRQAALEQVAAGILAEGREAQVFPADLADPAAVERVARQVIGQAGIPDILVNNAGSGRFLFCDETTPVEAAQMMAAPYLAAFAVTHAFLSGMLARGSGTIVNVTSPAAYFPWPGSTAYSAARWAMRGFTKALQADLYGTGIQVMLMTPGKVSSAYFEHNPGSEERLPRLSRFFRTLTPAEVAETLLDGVERDRREVVVPFSLNLTILAHRILPRPVEWLLVRTGHKRAAQP
jgi:short-subunit dehydrogenase